MSRSNRISSSHLHLYRGIAIGLGVIIVAMMTLGLIAALVFADIPPVRFTVRATAFMLGIVALILLAFGYAAIRREVKRSVAAHNLALAALRRDALTGALTRSYFFDQFKAALRNLGHTSLAYVQLDMDNLKLLNDGSGHAAGDAALQHLVATFQTVLPNAIIGRLGGDEFGIVIPGYDNKQAIRQLCLQALEALARPIAISGRHTSLGATMGIAIAPGDSSDLGHLVSKADLALYKGKNLGRRNVIVFDEEMHREERHKRFIERELRAAILLNELDLHYQPLFAIDGLTLKSYESLVRWNHTVRGTIPPSAFIPIAESSDLIDRLGDWVLRRACTDLTTLGAPSLAVNVSPAQLRRDDFAARFAAILADTGADATRLIVEITETVPLSTDGIEKTNLQALHDLGVKIAIDDFGAGNASLSYLKLFDFDTLKIDRSYIENIATNRLDSMMVSAICRIGQASNMQVVAEGIETEAQWHAVQAAGATTLQGFLLGRPKSLPQILSERRRAAAGSDAA